jgi:hypothetical protein
MLASRSVQRATPYGRQDKQQRLRPSSSPRAVTTHNQDVCGSDNQRKFSTEMNFHFPGYEGLDKPTVWIFPEVVVCLDCGLAELTVPEAELRTLAKGATA